VRWRDDRYEVKVEVGLEAVMLFERESMLIDRNLAGV
jgi:hypothetical protein